MPYQPIPNSHAKWRPASEAMADPKMRITLDALGNMHASREPGWLMRNMPYIVGGMMGYGALAGAGLAPAFAGGGAPAVAATPAVAPATLASMNAVPAASVSGMIAPAVAQTVGPTIATTAPTVAATAVPAAAAAGPLGGLFSFGAGGMGWPMVYSAGTNLLGSYLASRAAKKAAEQQVAMGQQALDFTKQRYENTLAMTAPWMQQGQQAMLNLSNMMSQRQPPPLPASANRPPAVR